MGSVADTYAEPKLLAQNQIVLVEASNLFAEKTKPYAEASKLLTKQVKVVRLGLATLALCS